MKQNINQLIEEARKANQQIKKAPIFTSGIWTIVINDNEPLRAKFPQFIKEHALKLFTNEEGNLIWGANIEEPLMSSFTKNKWSRVVFLLDYCLENKVSLYVSDCKNKFYISYNERNEKD